MLSLVWSFLLQVPGHIVGFSPSCDFRTNLGPGAEGKVDDLWAGDDGVPQTVKPVHVHEAVFFPLGNLEWDGPNRRGRNMAPRRAEIGGVMAARAAAVRANGGNDPTERRAGPPLQYAARWYAGETNCMEYLETMHALQEGAELHMVGVEEEASESTSQRHLRCISRHKRLHAMQEAVSAATLVSPPAATEPDPVYDTIFDMTAPPPTELAPTPLVETPQPPPLNMVWFPGPHQRPTLKMPLPAPMALPQQGA